MFLFVFLKCYKNHMHQLHKTWCVRSLIIFFMKSLSTVNNFYLWNSIVWKCMVFHFFLLHLHLFFYNWHKGLNKCTKSWVKHRNIFLGAYTFFLTTVLSEVPGKWPRRTPHPHFMIGNGVKLLEWGHKVPLYPEMLWRKK